MRGIIFLDFDGVLNSERWRSATFLESRQDLTVEEKGIDPAAVGLLNHLLARTGAEVVVTSTWRSGRSCRQLERLLKSRGFIGRVRGKTAVLRGCQRGDEIGTWLRDNLERFTPFVILDDDDDVAPYLGHLVQTTTDTGLNMEHVEAAIRVLSSAGTVQNPLAEPVLSSERPEGVPT
jgi:hypothetical protein